MLRLNQLIVCGAVLLMTLSLWPGYASGCWILIAFVAIAMAGGTWLVVSFKALNRGSSERSWLWSPLFAPVVTVATFLMLLFYVPRRIAFAFHRPAFDAAVTSHVPFDTDDDKRAQHLWLGVYRVNAIAVDKRGGTYFRTGTALNGPDRLSFGFAYQPNSTGTPFGRAGLQLRSLSSDWYWFTVSDDYH
jgi:hypothetical protein